MAESMLGIYLIDFGFVLFLFILGTILTAHYTKRKPTKLELLTRDLVNKMGAVIIPTSIGIVISIILITVIFDVNLIEKDNVTEKTRDISNWVTLVVEIGIAIVISLSILLYSQYNDEKSIMRRNTERLQKENHAKETIYSTLNVISEVIKMRERIRTMDPRERPDVNLSTERLFMNYKVKRTIESLQFVLLVHSENLPLKFLDRVRDCVGGLELVLNRIDTLPNETCDPQNFAGTMNRFIDELKTIS